MKKITTTSSEKVRHTIRARCGDRCVDIDEVEGGLDITIICDLNENGDGLIDCAIDCSIEIETEDVPLFEAAIRKYLEGRP